MKKSKKMSKAKFWMVFSEVKDRICNLTGSSIAW